MVVYGLVLGAIDAVSGRMLRATAEPSTLLALLATGWAAYRLSEGGQHRIAVGSGLLLWVSFAIGFMLCARLLVGWNGAVRWYPSSTMWVVGNALAAIVVAVVAMVVGSRAAARRTQSTAVHARS
jgi:hypothetical protein